MARKVLTIAVLCGNIPLLSARLAQLVEHMLDGKIIEYLNDEQKLNLPYIFKDRVQLNDVSEKGYQAYECRNLSSIYSQDFINISGNPSAWRTVKGLLFTRPLRLSLHQGITRG